MTGRPRVELAEALFRALESHRPNLNSVIGSADDPRTMIDGYFDLLEVARAIEAALSAD